MNSGVVVIKTENGPVRIDASDYDETKHELHVADEHHDEHGVARGAVSLAALAPLAALALAAPIEPGAPGRNYEGLGVMQVKNKFFIVDGANGGKAVDDVEGIEPKGYASNKEAWDVLIALKALPAKPATDNA